MYARVGYIQRNEVQCNFVPIPSLYIFTKLYGFVYHSVCRSESQYVLPKTVIFDCQLRFSRDPSKAICSIFRGLCHLFYP